MFKGKKSNMQHKFMTRNSNIEVMSCIQLKMCDRIKTYNSKPKQVHVYIGARTYTHKRGKNSVKRAYLCARHLIVLALSLFLERTNALVIFDANTPILHFVSDREGKKREP